MWHTLDVNPNYEITKDGQIRNQRTKKKLTLQERKGYLRVELSSNGVRKIYSVHRLVAGQFIPNLENKQEINHKDYNKKNNNIENLEWATRQENINYKYMGERGQQLKQQQAETIVKYGVPINEKAVLQYNSQGKFLQEYRSMSEAERQTGINRKAIRFCIRGKRQTAGNFIWKLK